MSSSAEPKIQVKRRVASASLWVTAGMLAGRLAGIVREFLIADTFGATREADLAILLVTGPEVLVTIAGTGAVGLVLIPILLDHDVGEQLRLVRRLTARLAVVAVLLGLGAVGLTLSFGSNWATESGLSLQMFRTAVVLSALAVPPSMVIVLTAEFLRAQNRFAVVSFSTVMFTLPVLMAIVTLRSVVGVAMGIAAGAVLRYVVQVGIIGSQWAKSSSTEVRLAGTIRPADAAVASVTSILLAAQLSIPLGIAALAGEQGDVALLNFGWRILLIPIGLLGSLFSVAAYPSIVRLLKNTDEPPQRAVAAILRPTIYLSVIVGIWLWVNATSAISVVYRTTGLNKIALGEISAEIRGGALAVPLITIGTAATTVLFGLKQKNAGLAPYVLATPVLIGLGILLIDQHGPRGLMYAMSAYGAVLCVSAVVILFRSSGLTVFNLADLPSTATALAGCGVLAVLIRYVLPGSGLVEVTLNGIAFVAGCLAAYAVTGRLQRLGSDRRAN